MQPDDASNEIFRMTTTDIDTELVQRSLTSTFADSAALTTKMKPPHRMHTTVENAAGHAPANTSPHRTITPTGNHGLLPQPAQEQGAAAVDGPLRPIRGFGHHTEVA